MLEGAMEPVVILFIGAFFGLCSEGIYRGGRMVRYGFLVVLFCIIGLWSVQWISSHDISSLNAWKGFVSKGDIPVWGNMMAFNIGCMAVSGVMDWKLGRQGFWLGAFCLGKDFCIGAVTGGLFVYLIGYFGWVRPMDPMFLNVLLMTCSMNYEVKKRKAWELEQGQPKG